MLQLINFPDLQIMTWNGHWKVLCSVPYKTYMVSLTLTCLLHQRIINVLNMHHLSQTVGLLPLMHFHWFGVFFFAYIFCPFSVLGAVLQKVLQNSAKAVIIAPFFATQPWFPCLISLVCAPSFILPPVSRILMLQGQEDSFHPLKTMTLGVFRISGNASRVQEFQTTLPLLSYHPGEVTLKNNMGRISKNGVSFVIGQRRISFSHL